MFHIDFFPVKKAIYFFWIHNYDIKFFIIIIFFSQFDFFEASFGFVFYSYSFILPYFLDK